MKQELIGENAARRIYCFLLLIFVFGITACTSKQTQPAEVHVAADGSDDSGSGTPDAPFATVSHAAREMPGSVIIVHGGTYGPVRLGPDCSGTETSPTVIRPSEKERVIIRSEGDACISVCNTSYIVIEGLETEGGTHGIEYESTREAGNQVLRDITIRKCTVHAVRGIHGICVYARNDLAPVSEITVEDCEVFDCECGSSESMVLNGNIDGFLIAGNCVHDNNNIGIDMIGFEGTAMHPEQDSGANPYDADQVRNGICRDNVIYNISTEGNSAYYEDGAYEPCADGIYVDGGRDIEICNNFIFNCDIGLEVATEHSPEDNELFRVTGVRVHDNVIADCSGWTGICFGGYDKDLGFTEGCEFAHNTLIDNSTQIGVQRSMNNRIHSNLILGGDMAVEFNENCREEDMVNDITGNAAADIEDEESWTAEYGMLYTDRSEIAEGFNSLLDDVGSRFVPEGDLLELYQKRHADTRTPRRS